MAKNALQRTSLVALGLGLSISLGAQTLTAVAGPGAAPPKLPSSGAGAGGAALSATPEDFANLKLAPGFLLDVEVYDAPELSGTFRVDENGSINFPLIGAVNVSGKTLGEARAEVQTELKQKQILNYPEVTMNVQQYAPFNITVLGEVNTPGRLQLLAPHNLADVIALAGGESALAGNSIEVRRKSKEGPEQTFTYSYSKSTGEGTAKTAMVEPGDTITVQRAGIVYVLGAVNRPGGFIMQEDGRLNISEALALAGGTSMQARTSALRIVRKNPDGSLKEIPVSYGDIVNGKTVPMTLEAQDIVYVPVSKLKAALTGGTGVLSAATSATIYSLK